MLAVKKGSLLLHILLMLVICALLYILFFSSLGWITGHGEEVRVPDVIGKPLSVAVSELQAQGFDIKIDSAYEPEVKPMTVLQQQPEPLFSVKKGRMLYLTVNKVEPPKTAMPNLIGLSFRSAAQIIKSNRLVLGDTSYKPDIAKGAILDQLIGGEKVKPGSLIPQGSRIDLLIGDGLGETELPVPDLIGQTYVEAVATLSAMGFQITVFSEGDIDDSASAIVLNQQPKAYSALMTENRLHIGDIVDLTIKQNPTPEELEHNRNVRAAVDSAAQDR